MKIKSLLLMFFSLVILIGFFPVSCAQADVNNSPASGTDQNDPDPNDPDPNDPSDPKDPEDPKEPEVPVITSVTGTWNSLTIPEKTIADRYSSYEGKKDVLHVAPASGGYEWTVLSYNLESYAGKEITITLSMDVWLETAASVAWQANVEGYPLIAGSYSDTKAGEWVKIEGTKKITVPAGGCLLYLSQGQLKTNKVFITNVSLKIDGKEIIVIDTEEKEEDGTGEVIIGDPGTGINIIKDSLTLTIGSNEKLSHSIASDINQNLFWSSNNSTIVSVSSNGTVKALNFSSGGDNTFVSGPATGSAVITVKTSDNAYSDTITVTATTAAQVDIMSLPPMKDQFKDYFLIGNIFVNSSEVTGTGASARISNTKLTRHYNALTGENLMKPSYLVTGRNATTGAFTWNSGNRNAADNFVNAANNGGIKVIGHTFLWHTQIPDWMWNQIATKAGVAIATKEAAIPILRAYITEVAGYFAGRVYSWDVLNEIFPDNASSTANWKDAMRRGASGEGQDANPWYVVIGSDFVYEGFLAARLADPNAILYYNDYNTNDSNRARLIRDMVKDVNDRYLSGTDKPAGEPSGRLLIEGIGMQEHHNTWVSVDSIRATINTFRGLNVAGRNNIRLSVSELDILAQTWGDFDGNKSNSSTVTNTQLLTQAKLYKEYMQLYIANKDIIERVSVWGVQDNTSWRSKGLPLLFDPNGKAKPAYYSFIGALE